MTCIRIESAGAGSRLTRWCQGDSNRRYHVRVKNAVYLLRVIRWLIRSTLAPVVNPLPSLEFTDLSDKRSEGRLRHLSQSRPHELAGVNRLRSVFATKVKMCHIIEWMSNGDFKSKDMEYTCRDAIASEREERSGEGAARFRFETSRESVQVERKEANPAREYRTTGVRGNSQKMGCSRCVEQLKDTSDATRRSLRERLGSGESSSHYPLHFNLSCSHTASNSTSTLSEQEQCSAGLVERHAVLGEGRRSGDFTAGDQSLLDEPQSRYGVGARMSEMQSGSSRHKSLRRRACEEPSRLSRRRRARRSVQAATSHDADEERERAHTASATPNDKAARETLAKIPQKWREFLNRWRPFENNYLAHLTNLKLQQTQKEKMTQPKRKQYRSEMSSTQIQGIL
ncbi:hypothetical protein B0H19DRAFT_1083104 [Mycena capillaripes]|nr:hypothetical protein B0H19DRAFT_1083104 [Mycena capillaripes]